MRPISPPSERLDSKTRISVAAFYAATLILGWEGSISKTLQLLIFIKARKIYVIVKFTRIGTNGGSD
jgi:hypothetical protein